MRPLIVLLLVVAALVTYFVAFDSTDSPNTNNVGPAVTLPEQPAETTPQPTELEGIEDDRTQVGIEAVEPETERTAPVASQSNRLTGLIVDPDNNPVVDADVILTRFGRNNLFFTNSDVDRSTDRKTKTNDQGRYAFTGVAPGNDYSLKLSHEDFAQHEVNSVQVVEVGDKEEPTIVMRGGISVSGTVRDDSGGAVSGAKVYLTLDGYGPLDDSSPDTMLEKSDGSGMYEFKNVGVGQWTLAIEADGFGTVTVPQVSVTGEVSVTKDVTLQTAEFIGGRVIGAGNEPLVGVTVQAFSLNQRSMQTRSSVESVENGEFVLEDVPAGSYTLLVNAPGYEPWRQPRVDSGEMGVLIELVALPVVSGTVRDAGNGQPLSKFRVRLRQEVPNAPVALPVQNTNVNVRDPEGAFEVPVPKPGNYIIEAVADGYAMCFSSSFTVTAGTDMSGVIVNMTRGGAITGTVTDKGGNPIRNARVTTRDKDWSDDEFTRALGDIMPTLAVERTVRTNAQGKFLIEGLTPTEYRLEVVHAGHPAEIKSGIHVNEGGTAEAGSIQLRAGGTVSGAVRDPSGNMVVGAVVQLQSSPGGGLTGMPHSYKAKTDSQGRYEVKNVAAGAYMVSVRRTAQSGISPFQDWQDAKTSSKQITVIEGESLNGIDFALGESRD